MLTFIIFAISTCILEWFKSTSAPKPYHGNKPFLAFRDNYLMVYSLMMGASPALDTLVSCYAAVCNLFAARGSFAIADPASYFVHQVSTGVKPCVAGRAATWLMNNDLGRRIQRLSIVVLVQQCFCSDLSHPMCSWRLVARSIRVCTV